MQDVNKQLKSELSKLVTHMKANTINQKKTAEMKRKIKTLQKQQHSKTIIFKATTNIFCREA